VRFIDRVFRYLPLSRKILLGFVPLFLVFVAISVVLQNHFQEREMMEEAQTAAKTYAEIIKEALVSMMVNNKEVDYSFLERINTLQQFDTLHILINDLRLRDEVLTEKLLRQLESKYRTLQPHDEIERGVLKTGAPVFSLNGNHFRAVIPFTATTVCQECHAVPVGYTIGATDLHISLERISQAAAGNWQRSLLIFLCFTAVAIGIASFMFSRLVAGPIDRLVRATKEISEGNLDYKVNTIETTAEIPAAVRSNDELLFLAGKFDEMRESLKEKIAQLDKVNRNLSERNREVEEALRQLRLAQDDLVRSERLAVTGRMTAQLSHEINNPIHNIQSLLESSLRKLNGNSHAGELIGVALEEVARMARLTRQMLDFYRGSVMEIERDRVDVGDLLAEVVRANEQLLSHHGIRMVLDVRQGLPCVCGSRDKLKQVFLNLVLNARDAMPSGGFLAISAAQDHNGLRIEVKDTGVGIPQENIGRIFDAFFTTKKEVSGVGLGLAISYGIIQQHGGTIKVQSTVEKGTTFTIHLPRERDDHG
jgi:signal transduction histidine kinase